MNHEFFIRRLRAALEKPLPGTDVQWEMASSDRMINNFPRRKRRDSKLAAVLILLYPVNDKIHTVFIQRPVYSGVHSGQISFPGGKMEEEDRDLIHTAVREACEEVGLCSNDLDILGSLTPLYIPVSNIEVSPVVAHCSKKPSFRPDRQEVVSLIEAALDDFLNPGIVREKPMTVRDEKLDIKYYDYKGSVIWGATAMILHELLVIIRREKLLTD
ncbi:MAG: CoA pyrophosphatase [Bacteroidales bacterium]|jgi:8-oxo-dGTP pyrophosphatase MutT (NUDIX family)|nr:CoA pyrophosphatase [Bacteroidales bacterium]